MTSKGDESRLLREALAAAACYPVFPVSPRGKTPAIGRWQQRASQEPSQVRSWFSHRPYNIGILTGRTGLLVVDLDTSHESPAPPDVPNARGGWDVLARLAQRLGQPYPGETRTGRTPTGGLHLYFRQPEGMSLPNSSGRLGWKIDTRGRGGYVVGPGSVRPEGLYRVIRPLPVAVLPSWIVNALAPAPAPTSAPIHLRSGRIASYVATALREECAAVAAAVTGTRHYTLLRAARILGEFVGANMLAHEVAVTALRDASRGHIGVDGFTENQADQAISDGITYGAKRPRTRPGGR